ncbi:MAG: 7TM domain-containing protein, partial [bacterium]
EVTKLPQSTVIFLYTLPILATLIGISRYIIGLRTFNLYPHLILTYIFFQLSFTNTNTYNVVGALKYGIFIVLFTLIAIILIKSATNRINMHFIPKKAITIIFICVFLLISLVLAGALYKTAFVNIDSIVLLLVVIIAEEFLSIYTKKGIETLLRVTFGTLTISILMFLLISWPEFQTFILSNSWVLVVVLVINYIVGKYMGLRITEYFRFKSLLSDDQLENGSTKPE